MRQSNLSKQKTARILAGVAKTTCMLTANSRCIGLLHQPKVPANLRRIKHKD